MALTMVDKRAESSQHSAWPPEIAAEFEREKQNPNPCVGNILVSETDRVRIWMIRLQPGERIQAVLREQHAVALRFQRIAHGEPDVLVVVHDQNRDRALRSVHSLFSCCAGRRGNTTRKVAPSPS